LRGAASPRGKVSTERTSIAAKDAGRERFGNANGRLFAGRSIIYAAKLILQR
jgi:hypothetical protein